MLRAFTDNRHLLRELVFRDIRSRYVGSIMGLFWSVLNPLLLLLLYTFVVAGIFRERLAAGDSTSLLAASIFCGLLPWLAVQESIIRSATCYLEEQNLIKKLRFPLEVLPLKITVSAIAHQLVGSAVFVIVLAIGIRLPGPQSAETTAGPAAIDSSTERLERVCFLSLACLIAWATRGS